MPAAPPPTVAAPAVFNASVVGKSAFVSTKKEEVVAPLVWKGKVLTSSKGNVRLSAGRPLPFGVSEAGDVGGLNFSLLAPGTSDAWLVLEDLALLRLKPGQHRTGCVWHAQVRVPPAAAAGLRYAWLLDPPLGPDGRPLGTARPIIDPCARCLDSRSVQGWNLRNVKYAPAAVVPDFRALRAFNWEGVTSPGLELKDLIIYEAHVRGYTRSPDSGVSTGCHGTFLGFLEKIPHLLHLGVNCVEFLPLFEFDETAVPRKHPETGEALCNYWGYNTVAFCVPMQRFAARAQPELGAAIIEFKTLVRELHRNGIEVVLDVVFNHTGEGAWGESNWHTLSAIAESHYYLMSHGHHTNYTGCGNTVNANSPVCAEWILDCLRFWAMEMHVDGFRFDLAAALCRGQDGAISSEPLLMQRLVSDPCLAQCKLIAEPWDCSWPDGYLVGQFPGCGTTRFAEWNGKFRDNVRSFIKGDPGQKGSFATRICGSADFYQDGRRGPCHSINFITAHDGFTLRDLVSYNQKHNSVNAEESGDDNNLSWNCGDGPHQDGPTKDPNILALREKQMRNHMVALFLSIGTPMMVAGDEYGRTQKGNNNTWCQDKLNWFSWQECAAEESNLLRFCRLLISFRKRHSELFCKTDYLMDLTWNHDNWEDDYNYISLILRRQPPSQADEASAAAEPAPAAAASCGGSDAGGSTRASAGGGTSCTGRVSLLIAFNAGHMPHNCYLPPGQPWYRVIATDLAPPMDICEADEDAPPIAGDCYIMSPYSCIVLKCYEDPADCFAYGELDLECSRLAEELRAVASRDLAQELLEEEESSNEESSNEDRVSGPLGWSLGARSLGG